MTTNTIAQGMYVLVSQTQYLDAFYAGLTLSVTIVAGCLGFSMLRTIVDDKEDL